jgi:hypothetical protein
LFLVPEPISSSIVAMTIFKAALGWSAKKTLDFAQKSATDASVLKEVRKVNEEWAKSADVKAYRRKGAKFAWEASGSLSINPDTHFALYEKFNSQLRSLPPREEWYGQVLACLLHDQYFTEDCPVELKAINCLRLADSVYEVLVSDEKLGGNTLLRRVDEIHKLIQCAANDLAKEFLMGLQELKHKDVLLFFLLYRASELRSHTPFTISESDTWKDSALHEQFRALRRAYLIRGENQSRMRPGTKVLLRPAGRLLADKIETKAIKIRSRVDWSACARWSQSLSPESAQKLLTDSCATGALQLPHDAPPEQAPNI